MPARAQMKPCPNCEGGIMEYSVTDVPTQPYEPLLEGGAGQLPELPQVEGYAYYTCPNCGHREALDA